MEVMWKPSGKKLKGNHDFDFSDVENEIDDKAIIGTSKSIERPEDGTKRKQDFDDILNKDKKRRERYPVEEDEFDAEAIIDTLDLGSDWFKSLVKTAMNHELGRLKEFYGSERLEEFSLYKEIARKVTKILEKSTFESEQLDEEARIPNPKNERLGIQKKHLEKLIKQYQKELVAWENVLEDKKQEIHVTTSPKNQTTLLEMETLPITESVKEKIENKVSQAFVNFELIRAKLLTMKGSLAKGTELSNSLAKLYESTTFKGYEHKNDPQFLIKALCSDENQFRN